jgi:hypothetical protein
VAGQVCPACRARAPLRAVFYPFNRAVREVVVLAAGLPGEAMPGLVVDYGYHTGDPDLDATALEERRLRRRAGELAAAAVCRTGQAAAQLVARGLPVRDAAALLGISPARERNESPE